MTTAKTKATHLLANGNTRIVEIDPAAGLLKTLQLLVGGYIEPIWLPNNVVMLVDEDGLSKQLPLNVQASSIAGCPIVGDAVVGPREILGD